MSQANTSLPPLTERYPALAWLRKNLFSTWYNALLTLLMIWLVYAAGRSLANWIWTQAEWEVVSANLRLFMAGQYPAEQIWRLWVLMYLLSFLAGCSLAIWGSRSYSLTAILLGGPALVAIFPLPMNERLILLGMALIGVAGRLITRIKPAAFQRVVLAGWVLYFPVFMLLVRGLGDEEASGALAQLPVVVSSLWGGLLLTFLLTVVGIVFSFPLGLLLALGRRSSLPLVKWVSIAYIELVRGVPLITILFMAQLMLPLFLPANVTVDRVLRAMVGITLFSAAYLAENVRGGLQAIPKGQFEAAHALGLNGVLTMGLIILPQALRLIIPILVGQFISLFKDTSLVAIVGLFDLLGIAKTVLAQPDFLGLQREVYAFISLIYWVLSYAMSYVSMRLEDVLGVGKR